MENQMWYYLRDNEQIGPVSQEELARLLAEGSVTPDTYIWADGMAEWLPAGQVPEFGGSAPVQPEGLPGEVPPPGVVRPTSVTVFGILNIVFGGLGLLCMPLALVGIFLPQPEGAQGLEMGPGMQAYTMVGLLVRFAIAILLIATGIGLLNLKAWARKWTYYYGWIAIVLAVIGVTVSVIWSLSAMQNVSPEMKPAATMGLVSGMCGGIIALIYPVFVLVYMKRPNVIDACQR